MNRLNLFLMLSLKDFIPGCLRGWHILFAVGGIICFLVGLLIFRNPGGRNFNDPQVSPHSPDIEIEKPENILKGLQADFNANSDHLSPVILHLARACDAVYANGETSVPRLFFDTKFDMVVPITSGPNAAIVGLKGDIAVVVFRGTDEMKDWYTNLSTSWVTVEHGKLHSGFWSAYQSLRVEIVKTLASRDLKKVWICGHSLGGAMALCCGYDFANKKQFPVSGIVTFGQPKIADGSLATHLNNSLNGKYLAVIADEDPVADVVPLCHFCGRAVWFNGDQVRFDGGQSELMKNGLPVFGAGPQAIEEVPFFQKVMSEEEFRQKCEQLKENDIPLVPNLNDPPIYKSTLPFLRDHNMSNYIDKLHSYFSLNNHSGGG